MTCQNWRPTPSFVKSYLHNGVFKSLKDVVHFYNMRDKTPDAFPPPDVNENINTDELGDLGLTDEEENDIVAFLETLSDGYLPSTPVPSDLGTITDFDPYRPVHDVIRVRSYRIRTVLQSQGEQITK